MTIEIETHEEYKMYLKKQLSKYIDEKYIDKVSAEMYQTFLDGISFQQKQLHVEV